MSRLATFFLLVLTIAAEPVFAQSAAKGFGALSAPEKRWVIAHPFIAKKAYRCALRARTVTDSIGRTGALSDGNGGQLDAYRHAYWMALMTVKGISERKALKLGKAHEKGNYRTFKQGGTEDGALPDSMMSVMDLRNNEAGIRIWQDYQRDLRAHYPGDTSVKVSLEERLLHAAWGGELYILKKDAEGNWLDCEGNLIDLTAYARKWSIPKCLVRSSEIIVPH